jgi:hypothetical protein
MMSKAVKITVTLLAVGVLFFLIGYSVLKRRESAQVNLPFEPAGGEETSLPPNDLIIYGDDFADGTIGDNWTIFNESLFRTEVDNGRLHIIPQQKVTWYKANNGPFIYTLIEGDFTLTARVLTRQTDQPEQFPNDQERQYQYAGIMLRDPASDSSGLENYLFAVVGFHRRNLAVETKSTTDDVSEMIQDKQWQSGDAELRICRLGQDFYLFKRHLEESEWTLQQTFERPDIGTTVQAGLISYAQNETPDLDAAFEFVSFQRISHPADCIANTP